MLIYRGRAGLGVSDGTDFAEKEDMLFAIAFALLGAASLIIIINGLRKAPEGYEDENGFHIVRNRANRPRLSALTRRPKARESYPVVVEHTV
jgi:hypothetical protein